MSTARRATVYLDADLHRALRVKAAETDKSISDLVNAAVRLNLSEDPEDLAAYPTRAKEPNLDLERVLKDLRRRGKLYAADQAIGGQGARRASRERPAARRDEDAEPGGSAAAIWLRKTHGPRSVSGPAREVPHPVRGSGP